MLAEMAKPRLAYFHFHHDCLVAVILEHSDASWPESVNRPNMCDSCKARFHEADADAMGVFDRLEEFEDRVSRAGSMKERAALWGGFVVWW